MTRCLVTRTETKGEKKVKKERIKREKIERENKDVRVECEIRARLGSQFLDSMAIVGDMNRRIGTTPFRDIRPFFFSLSLFLTFNLHNQDSLLSKHS